MQLAQYDVVKVKAILKKVRFEPDETNHREPRVGDVAAIIEVYDNPPGYELECCDENGITEWLLAFGPNEIELERIK